MIEKNIVSFMCGVCYKQGFTVVESSTFIFDKRWRVEIDYQYFMVEGNVYFAILDCIFCNGLWS